jgi:molecular chaperone GrpE
MGNNPHLETRNNRLWEREMTKKNDSGAENPEVDAEVENGDATETLESNPLAEELEASKQRILYLTAEIQNIRNRAQTDVTKAYKFSIEKFAKELLGVVDSLEHGISVATTEHDNAMREGMELTLKMLLDIFEKFGIKRVEPKVGELFNPNLHEALSAQTSEDLEPNKIMFIAQKGFVLEERLLRPARVIVAKAALTPKEE